MNYMKSKTIFLIGFLLFTGAAAIAQQKIKYDAFHPGELWLDNNGVHINAHGGGILLHNDTYYWFGEHKTEGRGGNQAHVGVHCYSSKDLYNWRDEGIALRVSPDPASDIADGCILERPKVIYNPKTGQFVMWFHLEPKGQGYGGAMIGIASSETVTGPYTYIRCTRATPQMWPVNALPLHKEPVLEQFKAERSNLGAGEHPDSVNTLGRDFMKGQHSRDMTLFVDDDGKAYHICSSESNSVIHINELTDDYLDFSGKYVRAFTGDRMEAPAIFKKDGLYYFMASECTGWRPNPAHSAVAPSIWGPWTQMGNPCVDAESETTYRSQSTWILPYQSGFIYLGDRWTPENAIDGRYIWLPVEFENGRFIIHWRDSWRLDDLPKYAQTKTFSHPGILHTEKKMETMRYLIEKKTEPAYGSFLLLKEHPCAQSGYKMQGPFRIISRDGAFACTKSKMESDFSAAYLNSLMWILTGDKAHAWKSLKILTAYADSLQMIPKTNDAPLLAGLEGFKIIYSLEILKHTFPDASQEKIGKIEQMFRSYFIPIIETFYATPPYTNGNWGPVVSKTYMAAGIYFDDRKMYDRAKDFYLHAHDNGAIGNYIDGETGQTQESGRDQGHPQLALGAMATVCELAWQQGDDLYSALGNRLLKGYEYVAGYNLGYDVPFRQWTDITGKYCEWTTISEKSRGAFRPIYEIAYNHFMRRKGFPMPYTLEVLKKIRPEGFERDEPAFGSLLFND
jgi:hypothetical protein